MTNQLVFKISDREKQRLKVRIRVLVWIVIPFFFLVGVLSEGKNSNWIDTLVVFIPFLGLMVFLRLLCWWINNRIVSQEIVISDDSLERTVQGKSERVLSTDIVSITQQCNQKGETTIVQIITNKGRMILHKFESMSELYSRVLALVPHIKPVTIMEKNKTISNSFRIVFMIAGFVALFLVFTMIGNKLGLSENATMAVIVIGAGMYFIIGKLAGGRTSLLTGTILVIGGVVQLIRLLSGT